MAGIVVLDEFTAGQIAAGEVVERPVSAMKELVENALDAGASRITVDLADGGLTKIRVADNGCGMTEEDVRLAFLRHATSKIKNAADLRRVDTLGFRGEALPSIAAVAKVVMTTRVPGAVTGTCLQLQGGGPAAVSTAGCASGTTVEINELFYNTPVRRKIMKNPSAENTLCGELLSKMALARPEVRFELLHRGRRVFYTTGSGKLLDAVIAVYGPGQSKEMLAVKAADDYISLEGYVGTPSLSRSSRSHLTVVINGRYVRCPAVVLSAIEGAYRGLLPPGRKPVAVLSLIVEPEQLDVNVHPAKLEVRLLEEKRVAALVAGALRGVLRGDAVIPNAIAERKKGYVYGEPLPEPDSYTRSEPRTLAASATTVQPEEIVVKPEAPPRTQPDDIVKPEAFSRPQPAVGIQAAARPRTVPKPQPDRAATVDKPVAAMDEDNAVAAAGLFAATAGEEQAPDNLATGPDEPSLFAAVVNEQLEQVAIHESTSTIISKAVETNEQRSQATLTTDLNECGEKAVNNNFPALYPLAQLLPTYILAGGADGLYIIDQHAAHERVLYEECLAGQANCSSQYLLLPETLELEHSEASLVVDLLPRFNQVGFVLEHFGGKTFLLRGAPSYLPAGREKELFLDMLDFFKGKGDLPEQMEFFKRLASSIACHGAIKAGEKMNFSSMEALLERLSRTENPFTCPHGRPTIIHLSSRDLQTRFKR